tara:strand:+ start:344 stop:478 length:135 start_codon:yes stop_codon:yes gene_type:complete
MKTIKTAKYIKKAQEFGPVHPYDIEDEIENYLERVSMLHDNFIP